MLLPAVILLLIFNYVPMGGIVMAFQDYRVTKGLFKSEWVGLDNFRFLIADAFELAAGKSISTLTLLEAPEFGNADCTVTITAYRDGKQIGTLNTELTLHTAYLWPKEVQ